MRAIPMVWCPTAKLGDGHGVVHFLRTGAVPVWGRPYAVCERPFTTLQRVLGDLTEVDDDAVVTCIACLGDAS